MADSRAAVLLEAAQYAADSDLDSFAELIALHQEWLCLDIVLRIILTYLPESVEPSLYLPLLNTLASWNSDPEHQSLGKGPPTSNDDDAERPQKLQLHRISRRDSISSQRKDIFEDFLLDRAHRIDVETGSLIHVRDLIEPFANRSEGLKLWFGATIQPLARLDFEFYPELAPAYTLAGFERLKGRSGVYALLFELLRRNKEEDSWSYGRDFRSILAPWVQGQARKMDLHREAENTRAGGDEEVERSMEESPLSKLWSDIFGALLDHAVEHHFSLTSLIQNWEGPHDSDMEDSIVHLTSLDPAFADEKYIQMMMALLYVEKDGVGKLSTEQESAVLRRAASLLQTQLSVDPKAINLESKAEHISEDPLEGISPIHLHHDELLDSTNPLTEPSDTTVQLGAFLATSKALMASLEDSMTIHATASLCLFGHAADQRARMQKVLNGLATHSATGDSFWRDARKKLLWLRKWNLANGASRRIGLFGQLELREMEVGILKTLARIGRFKLLTTLYIEAEDRLPSRLVEQVLVETALTAYDNASNGNKNRGGMKTASDIIATFRHQFPDSIKFKRAHALVQATHALSFYSLTLQHGTTFLPVNLRVHSNAVGLLDRVLEQNPQSYTKLDDLIEIGKNFVRAGLSLPQVDQSDASKSQDKALAQMERIVTAKAINASLVEGDFDTAYSYVVNRLSAPNGRSDDPSDLEQGDDLLWRAAYQAGRHQSTIKDGPSKLRRIEQRKELLSQAVLLAPPTALQEILETWNSCEAEFNACRAETAEEEEQWNNRGDQTIPGGFTADSLPLPQKTRESTRRAMQEEAPMGLFDVARGAAAAFSKSAFTPGQAGRGAGSPRQATHPEAVQDEHSRVRKRDMVSNAVTGGLVSGIGWMLGATPSEEEH